MENKYKIPESIINILNKKNKKSKEIILYENDNFILAIDIKNTKEIFHYTAWYKHVMPTIEYANFMVLQHIIDLKNELLEKNIIKKNTKCFVHYPPSIYQLHVHFTDPKHIDERPDNEILNIKQIEKYLNYKYLSKL